MTRRLGVLLLTLLAVVGVFLARLPRPPARSVVALRGHTTAIGAAATGSAWPEALHDPAHTGTAGARGPQSGHVRWRRSLGAA